ncbi:uncharacterized protein BDR25DRAFT_306866 [Lindgomyces ingoldianus]|uniref:Uncharacterized protein n=1 Tax=Lindgomyces ingoldianus TaxID=673940 RepID=A0ACB6QD96_9PLEO|nr:uncharacterized protein BDR25DRAFT_306866 [Lindgomyces ingoldianus]KAF2464999.1 hypothetical protein BDR25DRAFT_306866 [Lindgomyces ingoldianus]
MKCLFLVLLGLSSAASIKRQWSCPALISDCTKTYLVVGGDTCETVASRNGITTADFFSMNPSINSGCGNMYAGCAYCVSKIPGQTCPTNYNANCDQFYTVASGDICYTIIAKYPPLTLDNFYAYNPSIKKPECNNLMPNCNYCVHIRTAVPDPHQPNIKTDCQLYYQAVGGDYCYLVAQRYNVNVNDFMSWNPDVGPPTCLNMLAGDWYCVKP